MLSKEIIFSDNAFHNFKDYIYKLSGIHISYAKKDFLQSRLTNRLKELNLYSFEDYYKYLIKEGSKDNNLEITKFLDDVSTNLTYFYREASHFDYLYSDILPKFKKKPSIVIWSAGCAAGAEAYTIAICIKEYFRLNKIKPKDQPRIQIYGSDISMNSLKEAKKGIYIKNMLHDMPDHIKKRYFMEGIRSMKGYFKINPEVKKIVQFSSFNLLDPFSFNLKFDIIFCRNVMIYFNSEIRIKVTTKLFDKLLNDGYLFVSHSEYVSSLKNKCVASSIYQKR